jgi:hypothetical protein
MGGFHHTSLTGLDDPELVQQLLQHLPASSLTQLECCLDWSNAAQVAVLCELTALRSLQLGTASHSVHAGGVVATYGNRQGIDVLLPLSALQQLTWLRLTAVSNDQLQQLHLPQLQELHLEGYIGLQAPYSQHQHEQLLRLRHLTTLCKLQVARCGALEAADKLPLFLRELIWEGYCYSGLRSVKPLLELSCLQKLRIHVGINPEGPDAETAAQARNLLQLSTLESLQDVGLKYQWGAHTHVADADVAAAAAAWDVLPVKDFSRAVGMCRV